MRVADRIAEKLKQRFSPTALNVIDDSARHHGHVGSRPGGETHFKVEIVAAAFAGQTRVARQRLVYQALAEELAGPVHALELKTLTPEEAAKT